MSWSSQKTVIGIGVPECVGGRTAASAVFLRSLHGTLFMGGPCWRVERLAGAYYRYANPARSAHPDWRRGERKDKSLSRSVAMSLSSARVISFPTAVLQPVQQAPRRGRFPKCVTKIAEARDLSNLNETLDRYKNELAELERIGRRFITYAEECRYDAVALKQKIQNIASHR